jgi:hypothetical protein
MRSRKTVFNLHSQLSLHLFKFHPTTILAGNKNFSRLTDKRETEFVLKYLPMLH